MSGNDLNQGDVGNCWFVAACATLAGVKPLWEKVVVNAKDQVSKGVSERGTGGQGEVEDGECVNQGSDD